jgi:hypothetical protein
MSSNALFFDLSHHIYFNDIKTTDSSLKTKSEAFFEDLE